MSTKETKQSGETGTKGKHAKPNKTVTETCDDQSIQLHLRHVCQITLGLVTRGNIYKFQKKE